MAQEDIIGTPLTDGLMRLVVAIAALNWAVVEFLETNLLTDTLGLTGQSLTATYGIIGLLAVVVIYNTVTWNDWIGGM
jgi:uncharacterized membrane protein YuzA (DUF378 family)